MQKKEYMLIITGMRRSFVAMLVTLLLIPGSVFAFEFSAPPAISNKLAEIEDIHRKLVRTTHGRGVYRTDRIAPPRRQPSRHQSIRKARN